MGGVGGDFGTPGAVGATALSTYKGGGGGGGAAAAGGAGGTGSQPGGAGGTAGTNGTTGTPQGGNGGNGGNGSYSGGGGGGGGNGLRFTASGMQTAINATGGNGGNGGGTNFSNPGPGGGGGSGGYGIGATGGALNLTTFGTIKGGNGGAGGNGSGASNAGGTNGSGGDGGGGVYFGSAGSILNIGAGSITGGNGGDPGVGGFDIGVAGRGGNGIDFAVSGSNAVSTAAGTTIRGGNGGTGAAGGAGIRGSGMSVTNLGTIAGGYSNLNGTGAVQADAITFTGGSNSLKLSDGTTTGTLNGGIGITGSLTIDPGTADGDSVVLNNVIHDASTAGSLTKTGAGTLRLSGSNTYTGGTTINSGTLAVSANNNLGTGSLTFGGGTLSVSGTGFTSSRDIAINSTGTILAADANTNLTLSGVISDGSGAGRLITGGEGSITLTGINTYSGGTTLGHQARLIVTSDANLGAASGQLNFDNGVLSVADGFSSARTLNMVSGAKVEVASGTATLSGNVTLGNINGEGGIEKRGAGTLIYSGAANYGINYAVIGGTLKVGSATAINPAGFFFVQDAGSVIDLNGYSVAVSTLGGTAGGLVTNSSTTAATLTVRNDANANIPFSGNIQDGAGKIGLNISGRSYFLSGVNTYSGATIVSGESGISLSSATALSANSAYTMNGFLNLRSFNGTIGSLAGNGTVATTTGNVAVTLTTGNDNTSTVFAGDILDNNGGGTVALVKTGTGTQTLTGSNYYSGGTTIRGGALQLGNGGTAGFIVGNVANGGTLSFNRSNLYTFDGVIANDGVNSGKVTQAGTGNTVLSARNTYTGATTVDAGTLTVTGSIASSAMTTVNASGTLRGSGIVGNTTINGGTLAASIGGAAMTVQGNLAFTAASSYMIEVSPATAGRVNVTGTAALSGATVNASFAAGSYVAKQYTILNAAGGVNGTFGAQVNTNLPSSFTSKLSYDANNAYLDLTLAYGSTAAPSFGSGLSGNQSAVGNTLVNYFNANGGIPLAFAALTPTGLTQAAGETTAGVQQPGVMAATQFVGALSDPTTAGRGADAPAAMGFADESEAMNAYASASPKRSSSERDAYAAITKAVPRAPSFVPHWSLWVAGFGGSQTTDGNASAGTNTSTSRIAGAAVGADYWLSAETVAGFALAGGATNYSVGGGGSGRSDLFQIGGFVRHTIGASYITATAAYGWQSVNTDRMVGAEQLRAQLNTNTYTARLEGGHRFVAPWLGGVGLTPYAAAQVTYLDLPAYAETAAAGTGVFALAFGAKGITAPRTELGLRSDKSFAVNDAVLTLRGRAAWAHDYNTERSAAATFQSLPGASFVVNGARPAANAALTTAEAEWRFASGISVGATFEGEFSDVTRSYAGKGVVRYAW